MDEKALYRQLSHLFRAHPWHGVDLGERAPEVVNAFVEIVPTDTVKYEIDKPTGLLRIDRPQKYSNQCPALYGFLPQTYCGAEVGAFCGQQTGRQGIAGDGDPLDVCIFTERPISHGDILMRVVPIGGIRMIDNDQADDKIIAVLDEDPAYGAWRSVRECPTAVVDRLRHYFLTYKDLPATTKRRVEITHVYDAEEARQVIEHSRADYRASYGDIAEAFRTWTGRG